MRIASPPRPCPAGVLQPDPETRAYNPLDLTTYVSPLMNALSEEGCVAQSRVSIPSRNGRLAASQHSKVCRSKHLFRRLLEPRRRNRTSAAEENVGNDYYLLFIFSLFFFFYSFSSLFAPPFLFLLFLLIFFFLFSFVFSSFTFPFSSSIFLPFLHCFLLFFFLPNSIIFFFLFYSFSSPFSPSSSTSSLSSSSSPSFCMNLFFLSNILFYYFSLMNKQHDGALSRGGLCTRNIYV